MRVTIAAPIYPPDLGGPATYAKILADRLPGEGIEVSVVKFSDIRHLPKLLRHFAYFWRVFKDCKESDLVLLLDPVSTGFPGALAALLRRRPYVLKVVGDYAWEQGCQRYGIRSTLDSFMYERSVPFTVFLFRQIQVFVARFAKVVLVPSDYLKRIVSYWGIGGEKIQVIYNAVQPEAPSGIPDEAERMSRPRIVTAGRLVPWKGISGVIEAVERIRATMPEVSLVVVGEGPERQNLETYAQMRLRDGYCFTGALSHEQALAVIRDADLFVLNSTYEGLSHLLIEALSLGTPTIATNVGGNPELITDGVNGILVPMRDSVALSAACLNLLGDASLRESLAATAVRSTERFTKDAMVHETALLLRSFV